MNFERRDIEPILGDCVYTSTEYSFDFDIAAETDTDALVGDEGQTSIAIGTLQVEVAAGTGRALYVWGYHPHMSWLAGAAEPALLRPGAVFISVEGGFTPGVSKGMAGADEWTTTFDNETGWVRVSPRALVDDDQTVLIATATGLGLVGNQLNSVWLRPTFLDQYADQALNHLTV